jgi:hypothetical protein
MLGTEPDDNGLDHGLLGEDDLGLCEPERSEQYHGGFHD